MLTQSEIQAINVKIQNKAIPEIINIVFKEAVKINASDVHIKVYDDQVFYIKFRIDGKLQNIIKLPIKNPANGEDILRNIRTLIRSKCNVKTDEILHAQDWSFYIYTDENKKINLRVSLMPGKYKQFDIVTRILDSSKILQMTKLETVPFPQHIHPEIINVFENFNWSVSWLWGLILVTGPVWSWKTTTLYTFIEYLLRRKPYLSIKTLEDPIEYEIPWIDQSEIKDYGKDMDNQYSFAEGLKAILRQNRDVIVVWEIRDLETAELAIEAALTGHLVISTLHVNSAIDIYQRLIDKWVDPSSLRYILKLTINQRLLPSLCPDCKQPITKDNCKKYSFYEELLIEEENEVKQKMLESIFVKTDRHPCQTCWWNGTKGRTPIYEVILFDDKIVDIFKHYQGDKNKIEEELLKTGYMNLSGDLLTKIIQGKIDANSISAFEKV